MYAVDSDNGNETISWIAKEGNRIEVLCTSGDMRYVLHKSWIKNGMTFGNSWNE